MYGRGWPGNGRRCGMYFGFVAPLNVTQLATSIDESSPHTAAF